MLTLFHARLRNKFIKVKNEILTYKHHNFGEKRSEGYLQQKTLFSQELRIV